MTAAPVSQGARYPSLAGKRVLVTGGGSGIGAGIVAGFAAQGADVTFFDIAQDDSLALAEQLTQAGGTVRFEHVDLKDIAALQAMIAALTEQAGGFDVLVNNAANDDRHSIDEVTEAYWDDRLSVNLKHMFFCAQAVIPAMREKGGGAIVNLGSISWHLGLNDLILYQTCKAAIEGMTRSLARDLGRDNIRATCVIPGNVRTPRQLKWYTPEGEAEIIAAQCLDGRLMPQDVAAMVMFLASDDAKLVTGHSYFVDAGWR
ncbi:SDR family NAD(P)-dependent oxidoreductase [Sphingomonas turrisvirgatae]|uniref:3-oxoacyl-ACP reductase n=1 Tax=Sphingomonas turrisvirgatae TaxID=1888892 RepID=A0A1E3LYB5_9SPHN|nr:SDR family oxidoreductase [Sphingomonas turrisvirgatae]ODP38699.1 3-oxoacyl-ACP reductase [Sphingomonas turrisvirgatae]